MLYIAIVPRYLLDINKIIIINIKKNISVYYKMLPTQQITNKFIFWNKVWEVHLAVLMIKLKTKKNNIYVHNYYQ
jgi:hypothetical protein